jgi:hypothetical protein
MECTFQAKTNKKIAITEEEMQSESFAMMQYTDETIVALKSEFQEGKHTYP